MSLKHEDWHKLYHLDIHSIEKGKEALTNVVQRN